jgi:hypothetical protein
MAAVHSMLHATAPQPLQLSGPHAQPMLVPACGHTAVWLYGCSLRQHILALHVGFNSGSSHSELSGFALLLHA